MTSYNLIAQVPSVEDFIRLRKISGLSPRPAHRVAVGLANTLFAVQIQFEQQTIAMARVVGDGALNFDIVDVAVDPAHQRQGLGQQMMQALLDYIGKHADVGSYITLMADVPALYYKFGFELTRPESEGMYLPNQHIEALRCRTN